MTTKPFVLALLFTASASLVSAQELKPTRKHYELRDADGVVHYVVTKVFDMTAERHHVIILISDVGRGKFIIEHDTVFAEERRVTRFADVTGKAFLQVTTNFPAKGKTFDEALADSRKTRELAAGSVPRYLRVESSGGEWRVPKDGMPWLEQRDLRTRMRETLDASLVEALERMRETPFAGELLTPMRLVLHTPRSDAATSASVLDEAEVPADCGFDKSFGFPCSDAQEEALREAAKKGEPLSYY